jgi:molybdopterin/thiamine biosynthesis adenylyltransferase
MSERLPQRPQIKSIFGIFYLDRRIRLGTGLGYAAEIEDPHGRYAALLRRLDGTADLDRLTAEMAGVLDEAQVREALGELASAGYLEDAADPAAAALSEDQRARYRANLNFFSTLPENKFNYQQRLMELKVALIGLGGIGSNVAMALAELGVGAVTAIDFDRVELSNLNRQVLYSTSEVGELKAEAAERRLRAFNPEMRFKAESARITSLADVEGFLDGAAVDLVFCLADKPNGYIDYWVNEACVRRGLPLFAGSIFAGVGNAYAVLPGQSACYACRVDAELGEAGARLSEEIDYIRTTDFNVSNGAMGPTCMFHAYFLSYEMLRHVLGLSVPLTANRLFEIDFLNFTSTYTEFERQDDCRVCGAEALSRA